MKRRVPLLVALAVVLAASAPGAAPVFVPAPRTAGPALDPLSPICTPGVAGTPVWLIRSYVTPPETYFTRLDPQSCGCTVSALLTDVHVMLSSTGIVTGTLTASIVASHAVGPGCLAPLPDSVLCGPVTGSFGLAPGVVTNVSLALPATCCLDRTAFLRVSIDAASGPVDLVTDGSCLRCVSYVAAGSLLDLCYDEGFPGKPLMWVDARCCYPTEARPGTWGRLKTLYR